jgi:hypothetical protein
MVEIRREEESTHNGFFLLQNLIDLRLMTLVLVVIWHLQANFVLLLLRIFDWY